MADENALDTLRSYLIWPDSGKNTNQQLRQRIALQMMSQRKGYPKNIGEGLTAIGDAIGDMGTARMLERSAAAGAEADKADVEKMTGGTEPYAAPPPPKVSAYPEPVVPTATVVDTPPPVVARSTVPPPVVPVVPSVPDDGSFNSRFDAARPFSGPRSDVPPPAAPVLAAVDPMARNRIAALAMQNGTAPGVPQQNPMLAGSVPRAMGPAPSAASLPSGSPDQRLALAPTGTVSDAPPILPSGIRTAPPVPPDIRAVPPPVRVAETVNPYEAAAHEPVVPSQVPMTRQEFELRKAASDPNRPERAQMLRPYIEQLEANRSAENARRVEQYRKDLELHNQLKMKGLEYRAGEPERVLNREKLQQEIAKGKIPEVKQDVETGLVFNPATGEWEQPRIAGADPDRKPPFKGSEFQGKAMVNYGRARLAQEGLRGANEQLLAGSPVQSTLSSLPFGVGRPLRSDAYKEADTHAENFVQAFIRQQSGGAYTPTELESEARAMLPRYGDSEQIIQNKREQREQFLNGMYSIIGSSGQKSVDIDAARREADRAAHPAKETKPVDPLEGREAVFPDKSIRVRRDGKWVPK